MTKILQRYTKVNIIDGHKVVAEQVFNGGPTETMTDAIEFARKNLERRIGTDARIVYHTVTAGPVYTTKPVVKQVSR